MSDETLRERMRCISIVTATISKAIAVPTITMDESVTLLSVGVTLQSLITSGRAMVDSTAPSVFPLVNGPRGGLA